MPEDTGPRGFVRVYVDIEPALNDRINAHCKENGITKKYFFYRTASDFFSNQSAKVNKHGTSKKRK